MTTLNHLHLLHQQRHMIKTSLVDIIIHFNVLPFQFGKVCLLVFQAVLQLVDLILSALLFC